LYRGTESTAGRPTLIRLLGDFDLAEEALHEAFAAAWSQWGASGIPANPRAWLVSTGRFRAIDAQSSCMRALELVKQAPERRFLERQLLACASLVGHNEPR
jgi:predicted RNA polymerase sigma factor